MKLSDWAKEQGLSYMTCYRWFKENKLPSNIRAYQTESGTIMVEQNNVHNNRKPDPVADLLSAALEFSLQNKKIVDFASYVISNFNISNKEIENKVIKNIDKEIIQKQSEKIANTQISFYLNKDADHLKRKKNLLKIIYDLNMDLTYDILDGLEYLTPIEIFEALFDEFELEKINDLILGLRKVSNKDSRINDYYDFENIKEIFKVYEIDIKEDNNEV